MQRPDADIEVSIDLARWLLRSQHPDLAGLELRPFDEGWDNVLYRLGDSLIVRLPRRKVAVELMLNEQRWLGDIARRTTLKIPAPLRVGTPCVQFNFPWSIVPWIEGTPGDQVGAYDQAACAQSLGTFLRQLHESAPHDAPGNDFRGVALAQRRDTFDERCKMIGSDLDVSVIRHRFQAALDAAPWAQSPRWLHGDLHPGNTVFSQGQLVGVVDFGDMCAGDPATDLAGAWMLLEPDHLQRCFEAYGGVEDDLRLRARGWATIFGVMFLSIASSGYERYQRVGRITLQRVAAT